MNRLLENLSSPVSQKELQNAERKFMSNYEKHSSWRNAAFEYACCLLRSGAADVRNGIRLFEDLLETNDNDDVDEVTNDQCIFCMAFGYYRIEEYATSLRIIKGLLEVKPHCKATLDLQRRVNYEVTLRRIKSALWVAGREGSSCCSPLLFIILQTLFHITLNVKCLVFSSCNYTDSLYYITIFYHVVAIKKDFKGHFTHS
ncbi:Mitochondrial fission 1 protein [Trichinella pseudospiralis]